jgi:hypothetical protein
LGPPHLSQQALKTRIRAPAVPLGIELEKYQSRLQFLAGDYFPGTLQQYAQNPKRLLLWRDFSACFVDFSGAEVNFEEPGANTATGTGGQVHNLDAKAPDFTPGIQVIELNNVFRHILLAG